MGETGAAGSARGAPPAAAWWRAFMSSSTWRHEGRDETCPVSTGRGTRRVHLVQGEGGRGGKWLPRRCALRARLCPQPPPPPPSLLLSSSLAAEQPARVPCRRSQITVAKALEKLGVGFDRVRAPPLYGMRRGNDRGRGGPRRPRRPFGPRRPSFRGGMPFRSGR